ncbi:hypothetical protein SAMN04490243_2837 [Robiginitalea myxolifaciens]|uniref:YD repeat-containing protein n=1 Tax=Robiginitalea myxolifaciens TaxID=400055 RepID=A0A1I6HK47_9FLAO|nr:hypothetical protein [Robiginitalea myxolifaciens]SFR54822.1 hypothetical protein SAMN04490243_2837 [Robiginitalea myxolifaciens]
MLDSQDFDYSPRRILRDMLPYPILTILLLALVFLFWTDGVFLRILFVVFMIYAVNLVALVALGTGEQTSHLSGRILLCNLGYSAGLTLILLLFTGFFRDSESGVLYFAAAGFGLLIATFFITTLSFLSYYLIWRKQPAREPWNWKSLPVSGFLLVSLFVFGFFTNSRQEEKGIVRWSEREVNWEDFYQVGSIEGGYSASIYSGIASPDVITDSNPSIYAYMDPDFSEKLEGMEAYDDVLRHEQYHFNITEYCARLMRKEVLETGLGGLSTPKLKEMHQRYYRKLDSLQDAYDTETDHSVKYHSQQAWEAQIDDWLRQTANFAEENMYNYHQFAGGSAQYYKHIYFTMDQELLTSLPVGPAEFPNGETYEVEYSGRGNRTITFYRNGEVTNGGYFGTAVVELYRKKGGITEVHYKNQDKVYTRKLMSAIIRTQVDSTGRITSQYFNDKDQRIAQDGVYEISWRLQPDSTYRSVSRNQKGEIVPKEGPIYFEERRLDKRGRTIYSRYLDRAGRPVLDDEFIASRQWEYNKKNQRIRYRKFDKSGAPAVYLSDYHLTYDYDEYGQISRVSSLDQEGNPTYDNNGASIYEYTYDLKGRETSIKRLNAAGDPIVANDDYFMKVYEYGDNGKLAFEASYYPGYVLKFTEDRWGATRYAYEGDSITLQYNYDAYGNLMSNDDEVAAIKQVLNAEGQVARKIYLDTLGLPMAKPDGVVAHQYTYDDVGNTLSEHTLDSLGSPLANKGDVALTRWEYDSEGNVVATRYFDTDDKPVALDGTHKTTMEYNETGLVTAVHEYDLEDQPIPGVATTRYRYNTYGTLFEELYFDGRGRRTINASGISGQRYLLNKRDYATGVVNIDSRGRITNNYSGYALQRRQLNELGHLVSLSYYDERSQPVSGPSGYHKLVYEWAPVGEIVKVAYFNTSLNPTSDNEGTAVYEYTLAPSGMDLEVRRYNEFGRLADNWEGKAISKYAETQNGLYYLYEELNSSGEVVFEDNDYRFIE